MCVERYGYLPVDKDAFKGDLPNIDSLVPYSPFAFYLKRKLYIHNMGHATCAYLGGLLGLEYIFESIDRDDVYIIVKNAMEESAQALSRKYNISLGEILRHINDLLYRFTNAALKDTCQRVGGDPRRKLSPSDRLIGAGNLAAAMGVQPAYIAIGTAAGLYRYIAENKLNQNVDNAKKVLTEVSELNDQSSFYKIILDMYERIIHGDSIRTLRLAADRLIANCETNVI